MQIFKKLINLNSFKKVLEYRNSLNKISKKLSKIVNDLKNKGFTIAGYGAAAKGLTILKCSKLGSKHISYFVDDSPAKQGFYTPSDHIPIITRKEANKKAPRLFYNISSQL